jgi:hypothetical protein
LTAKIYYFMIFLHPPIFHLLTIVSIITQTKRLQLTAISLMLANAFCVQEQFFTVKV